MLSFQKAEVIYDLTFRFAKKYLERGDRTVDQMIQAARSGKKNILDGSKIGTTSKKLELNLTNIARGSLEELLDDYKNYLRARDMVIWDKNSKEALFVRKMGKKSPLSFEGFREIFETRPPGIIANLAICLINQANDLIDQQLKTLDREFVSNGGLSERTRIRNNHRNRQ
ncbi:MAG: four helix bundle suffix domain-containing protein [Verrucomicrobiales bacterium]|nr:four helix bundle suffix domain-containing protein [Verrucomicrobiales bacterium]